MTIASETNKSGPYFGNGVTTTFPFDFKIDNAAHIRVVAMTGAAEVDLALSTDYTVTGVGGSGGSVILTSPPLASTAITLVRSVPFTQEMDLQNQGAFFAEAIETGFDLSVARDQQLAEELSRTVRVPISSDPTDLEALIGGVVALLGRVDDISTVAGVAAQVQLLASVSSDVHALAAVIADIVEAATFTVLNVKRYGAVGNGTTDDTAAIQAAIDAAPNSIDSYERGGVLVFPSGIYKISNELRVNKNLEIIGLGNATIIGNVSGALHKAGIYVGDATYLTQTSKGYFRVDIKRLNFRLSGHNYDILNHGVRTFRVEDCTLEYGQVSSIETHGSWATSWVKGCEFQGGGSGALRILDNSNAFHVESNRFAGYDDTPSDGYAVYVRDSMGAWITHNDFEYCTKHIVVYPTISGGCNNLHIENNWIEGAFMESIRLDNSLYGFKAITIKGNSVYGSPDGSVYVGVAGGVGDFEGVDISGNTFNAPATLVFGSGYSHYKGVNVYANTPLTLNGKRGFSTHKNGTHQTGVVADTWTKLTWAAESYDDGPGSSFSGDQWDCGPGKVRLSLVVAMNGGVGSGTTVVAAIYKNGALLRREAVVSSLTFTGSVSVTCTDKAVSGDIYSAYIFVTSPSGAISVDGTTSRTYFEGAAID